ncbi:hypothetical protein F3Y22_tig00113124pilonHSYRG00138 [Hibiscus syriacus]|uniref:Reverse transcriptase domain-containing protein n=1 Tax=Hibiscus syriacus TaxID=106335 RepID=A0A6A2WQH2_HIBSY|nr:hypothetical protein F3Y22_tig00113124pilonHSYRG00138 [Hibiscus syriacus]
MELCVMTLECCSQERTYLPYYGLLGKRFCQINKFFAHLLGTDALPWHVLAYVRLTKEDTTSSRIFIKILFQKLSEHLGIRRLNERLLDPSMQDSFKSIFPRDNPKNTVSINFFTSIGLSDEVLSSIEEKKTAKEIWDHLTKLYEATSLHNKIFLKRKLYTLREQERVELLLQSLPDSYDQLIINLTNSNVTSLVFDDVAAAVLQEENRRKNKEDRQVNLQQAEALTTMRRRSTERGQSSSHKHKDCWSLNKNSNPQGNTANTSDDGDALCCEASTTVEDSAMLWHHKLGHMSEKGMKVLVEQKLLTGLTKVSLTLCEHCITSLEKSFWAAAVNTACYLVNRAPSTAIELKTPMEMWTSKPVDYSNLHVFRSIVYVMYNCQEISKLDPKSMKCKFLGYADGVKGYRLWDLTARKVIISMDVIFVEDKLQIKEDDDSPGNEMVTIKWRGIVQDSWSKDMLKKKLDVKTSFLHGNLEEEIYMLQPEGFEEDEKKNLVCRLNKSLYGLKQAPRYWYKRFDSFIMCLGYNKRNADPCAYFKRSGDNDFVILLLYVDDMLVAGPNKDHIEELNAQLAREFEMKDLGSTNKILGMQIHRDKNCKPISTPLPINFKLSSSMSHSSEEERMKMSRVPYASAVRSLMFVMICTRPDIAQAVGVVSRYMANPGKEHWNTVKRILRYIKGTSNVALCYGGSNLLINGWVSKLQSIVATSTTEAEYVAATQASKEAIWLKMLLEELGHNQEYVSLFCDSQSALHLARNPTFHSMIKHIRVQYHFIREKVEEGTVDMQKIHIKDNIADFMTKAIKADKFTWYRSSCGLSETTCPDLSCNNRNHHQNQNPMMVLGARVHPIEKVLVPNQSGIHQALMKVKGAGRRGGGGNEEVAFLPGLRYLLLLLTLLVHDNQRIEVGNLQEDKGGTLSNQANSKGVAIHDTTSDLPKDADASILREQSETLVNDKLDHSFANIPSTSSIPQSKNGRGKHFKDTVKGSLSGSKNKFEVLNSVDELPNLENQPRKPRAASLGVAGLVKELKSKKKNQIDKVKRNFQGKPVFISAIYGSNDGVHRRQLWQKIKDVESIVDQSPWVLGGDYNIFLHAQESSDHDLLGHYLTPDMKYFHVFTQELALHDHPFFGPKFTWSNKQQELFLARKLDRVLVNPRWDSAFPNSFVEFLAAGVSDHCMAVIWLSKYPPTSRPKPFKFFNFWTAHPYFLSTGFNIDHYSNLSDRIKLKRAELEYQQLLTLKGEDVIEKELELQDQLKILEEAETNLLKQKAKVHWMRDGDKNTKIFQSIVAFKNKRDTLRILVDDNGNRLETYEDMSKEVVSLFSKLLGTSDPMVKDTDPALLNNLLNFSMPAEASSNLVKEVTEEEIKNAIFCQGNDKAPGPDGFTPYFFKISWAIVGNDVMSAIKFFFSNAFIHPAFNSTIIALVPKIPNPSVVKDFRLISCCSVIYKAITKILVNKMNAYLPQIITMNQTAFIRGRNIIDNSLLAQEMVKGYGRKVISPRCSMKIDLHKAFDSLHWGFILSILQALQFPNIFIDWIEICFTQAMYSISFNGSLTGYFKGARGLRRRDPISPYLFVLAMNVLSNMLNLAAAKGIFAYHPKCKKIGLTHIFFADDLLIFCKGYVESGVGVLSVLDHFYQISGLNLNSSKSELFAAAKDCEPLLGKIRQCLQHWSDRNLSYDSSLELIRSVLFSVCNFWCRQLILPASILKSVDQLCSRACTINLIRKILAGDESLWVAWLKSYVLKEHDFWNFEAGSNVSWSFCRILKLRSIAFPIVSAAHQPIREVYDKIRIQRMKVCWNKLIWYPLHIPKHSLISWMALLNRLPTRDRLQKLGLCSESTCVNYCQDQESRDHLFSQCPFAVGLWKTVWQLNDITITPLTWETMVSWASKTWRGKSLITTLLKISWNAFIYFIWQEMNQRIFQGRQRSIDILLNDIIETVSIRLRGKAINRHDSTNQLLCNAWGIV